MRTMSGPNRAAAMAAWYAANPTPPPPVQVIAAPGDRLGAWRIWHAGVLATVADVAMASTLPPGEARDFLVNYYGRNEPCMIQLPDWPGPSNWTLDSLTQRIGPETIVQVQAGRLNTNYEPGADQHCYESRAFFHRTELTFGAFVDRIVSGPDNDTYLTSTNNLNPLTRAALAPLIAELAPSPPMANAGAAHLWIGGRSTTPLHHDIGNNLLCQIVGTKSIRMIDPSQIDRVGSHRGTHSSLGWVTDKIAAERGLVVRDFTLTPGHGLFIPSGWFHCVKALEPSISAGVVIWPNSFEYSFPD
jgi:hypothetical protein